MIRAIRTLAVAAGIIMAGTFAAAQTPSDTPDNDGWRTIIYPINAWVPVFGADIRLPPQPPPDGGGGGPVIPSAKTSGNFNGAAAAGFRIERSRLSVEGTFLWAGMSGSVELPRLNLKADTITGKLTGGFRVAPALYVDAGVRHLAVKMTADVLDFPEVVWQPGIWEPVVGFTYRPELGRKLRLFTQADYGGIGEDDHKTFVATGILEWKPLAHFALGGGYGVIYFTADGTVGNGTVFNGIILGRSVHLDQTLHGPKLTIGIPF